MKIAIFAAGSRGDIQPCVALAKGLVQAGYNVQLAAPQDFSGFVQASGVDFFPLRGDVQSVMATDVGREFMEKGSSNPLRSITAMRMMLEPIAMQMAEDGYRACLDADGIICLGVLSAFGMSIAEATGHPIINLEPTPMVPTRAFPAPGWPIQSNLGGLHNYLSGLAMLMVIWMWYKPFVNRFRKRLDLSRLSYAQVLRKLRTTPMLGAYSPSVIPRPEDWSENFHAAGFFFLESPSEWKPPSDLQRFLEAGEPPVYVGFGSMSGRNPQRLADTAIRALAETNQRGILLSGWGGLLPYDPPPGVMVAESMPHSWLFPRVSAVVHHGGAGTTAEGLRAGAPTIIIPFAFDQKFWGARVHAMGVGPPPINQKELTVEKLSEAIRQTVSDQSIKSHAKKLGASIQAESGVESAVKVVRRYFG